MTSRDLTRRIVAEIDALVRAAAADHGDDPESAGLLVALSGGPDSVALLHLAAAWAAEHRRPLAAAHFDHRLRGEASDGDAAFCHQITTRLGVPLFTGRGDPRPRAREQGRGLEDAARALRHAFLDRVRAEHELAAIATGHHRDDQIETVLMRLCRGTGLDGLVGLRARRGRLVRPLLGCTRAELLAFLADQGLPWRQDATNLDGSNVRGRVRRELLPLIADIFGSGATDGLARLADLAADETACLDTLVDDALVSCAVGPADDAAPATDEAVAAAAAGLPEALSVSRLRALPPALARRVVRRWLHPHLPVDLAHVHVAAVLRWVAGGQSGGSLDLPGPLRLVRTFDRLHLAETPPPDQPAAGWRVNVTPLAAVPDPVPPPRPTTAGWQLVSSADGLAGNLQVRRPRPGDRLQPFGLAGHKKLSDLVQEKRIPSERRRGLLVVADQLGPLWVVGVAQDERTRVLPATKLAVTITVEPREAGLDD